MNNFTNKVSMQNQQKKYIGYWRKNFLNIFDEYPYPSPNLYKLNQSDIIIKTKNILNKYGTIESYFGHSKCRICNNYNEYSEYSISYNNITYIIPFGYFHYLEMHNVKIDSKLVEIVQYFEGLQFEI
jgi:hypothetical protein